MSAFEAGRERGRGPAHSDVTPVDGEGRARGEATVADPAARWLDALQARHFERLRFAEVRKGLQALSSLYVERRARLPTGAALEGRGKRAAFAVFYAPLHFFLVRAIVRGLEAARPAPRALLDLGCGTGVAGAAWALEAGRVCRLSGVDRSGWAVDEARWNWERLGVEGRALRGDLVRAPLPGRGGAVVAAFSVNELEDEARPRLLAALLAVAGRGARVLVVESIARRGLPWWPEWSAAFAEAGGREDEWRVATDLPEQLRLLDRAAGLDHREMTGRSLFIAGGARRRPAPRVTIGGDVPSDR